MARVIFWKNITLIGATWLSKPDNGEVLKPSPVSQSNLRFLGRVFEQIFARSLESLEPPLGVSVVGYEVLHDRKPTNDLSKGPRTSPRNVDMLGIGNSFYTMSFIQPSSMTSVTISSDAS